MRLRPQQGERKGLMLSLVSHWLLVPQICQLLIINTIIYSITAQNDFIVSLPLNSMNRILARRVYRTKIYLKQYFICYPSAKGIFGKGQTQLTLKIGIIFSFHKLYAKEHAEGNQQVNILLFCFTQETVWLSKTSAFTLRQCSVTYIRVSDH